MELRKIDDGKKRVLPLLLLGDEQESMIDRYLESSDMFAMFDRRNVPIAIAVVSKKAHGQYELMNLAVAPCHQRKGYGSQMIEFICNRYKDSASELLVGTGENPATLEFYRKNKLISSPFGDIIFPCLKENRLFPSGGRQPSAEARAG